MKRGIEREEKICEVNPNCNDIVGFTRTVNSSIGAFLGATILSTIIVVLVIRSLFVEDK